MWGLTPVAGACARSPRAGNVRQRLRAFVACRPCAVGWAVYLAVAILIVALFGGG